jgi:DNA adenine methylase
MTASDAHPGTIALYQTLQANPHWLDGVSVDENLYREARSWPDDCPLKAFIGFACSFGGKWFGGFARRGPYDFARAGARSLFRKIDVCRSVTFKCASFFDRAPALDWVLYCDPPYANTTGYRDAFDSDAFADRVAEWADAGSIVFVSEYNFPIGRVVWERERAPGLSAGRNGPAVRKIDRLYRVGPEGP